jgi:hypothetical protein
MKATEVIDAIFDLDRKLNQISDAIAKGLEYDGIDDRYLKNKMQNLLNTANHIHKFQLRK